MTSHRMLLGGGVGRLQHGAIAAVGSRVGVMTGTSYKSFPGMCLRSGRLHLVYRTGTAHNSDGGTINYKYSDDEGATWSTPGTAVVIATPASGVDYRDPSIAALASGRLIVGFDVKNPWNGSAISTYTMYSDDGGTTWSSPAAVADSFTGAEADGTSQAIQLGDGTVLLPGYGLDTGDSNYRSAIWVSTDGGATFGGEITIADGSRWYQEPQVRLLTTGDIVGLIRSDTNEHTWRVLSSDGGATWSSPSDVLTASSRPDWVEYRPGRIILFGRNNNSQFYARWTTSRDSGLTWDALANVDGASDVWMYGAPVVLGPGRVGIVYSIENSGSDADLYYRLYSDTGA